MWILVVDDEPPVAEMMASFCAGEGHQVAVRTSSVEALDFLAAERVDVLATDIAMPPPDGLFLIREARKRDPRLVAMAITGYAANYSLGDVLQCGASDLIIKPVRLHEFRARLALAIERQRTLDALIQRQREFQVASARTIRALQRQLDDARNTAARTSPAIRE